jgi:hypothetical protein
VEFNGEKLIAGHGPLAEFLTSEGFPTKRSTMAKYCSPAQNSDGQSRGPAVHSYWNKHPMFVPSVAIAWAKSRHRSVEDVRSERNQQKAARAGAPSVDGVA